MNLWKEILIAALSKEEISVSVPNLKLSVAEIAEQKSFQALQQIKIILENEALSDFECVEEIVCVLERLGSGGGSRHDFG